MPKPKLLNIDELCKELNVSRSTYYNMKKAGKLPPPIMVLGSPRWIFSEVIELLPRG